MWLTRIRRGAKSEKGNVLVELTAVIPVFLSLTFLSLEYSKYQDDLQRIGFVGRELVSVGLKTCGYGSSMEEMRQCAENGRLKEVLEDSLLAQTPDRPALVFVTIWSYDGDAFPELRYQFEACVTPFGYNHATPDTGCGGAYTQVGTGDDAGWIPNSFHAVSSVLPNTAPPGWNLTSGLGGQSRFFKYDKNLEYLTYNRCNNWRWVSEASNDSAGPGGIVSKRCFLITGEGFIPYQAITPVGSMMSSLLRNSQQVGPNDMMYISVIF